MVVKRHWFLIPFILLWWGLALDSLVDDSPTMDEQNHLARGLALWGTGDPRLSLEHPPLANSLAAAPVHFLLSPSLPLDHPSWEQPEGWYAFAEQLLWVYNDDVERMIFLGRLPIVWLSLAGALLLFSWGRALWGIYGGMAALFLFLFDPNILAHSRYITTDLGGMVGITAAAYGLWSLWQRPVWDWRRWLVAVLGFGWAFSSKLSTLGFVPLFGLLALVYRLPDEPFFDWKSIWRRLWQLGTAGLGSLLVIWTIFGWQWGPIDSIGGLAGPMPTFWAGIAQILSISGGGRPTFLLGEFSSEGFALYFPIAFLAKTPLPLLLLLPGALYLLLFQADQWGVEQGRVRRQTSYLLLLAVGYFGLSLQSSLNIGYRHLLPMWPFLHLLIAGGVAWLWRSAPVWKGIVAGLFVWLLLATIWIHPHYLSYFNPLWGGPENGYNVLIDSNVDWGQDLMRLEDWWDENGRPPVKLSWFGTADPAYYGLVYEPLPGLPRHFNLWWEVPFNTEQPEPGLYIISATNLWELPLEDKTVFAWFREQEPTARIGYSVLIFEVKE